MMSMPEEKKVKRVSKFGRRGDERMHRSLQARLANPKLSLLDALLLGGYQFTKDEDGKTFDSDNVQLSQRRNQLSRRLRLYKQQLKNDANGSNSKCKALAAARATNSGLGVNVAVGSGGAGTPSCCEKAAAVCETAAAALKKANGNGSGNSNINSNSKHPAASVTVAVPPGLLSGANTNTDAATAGASSPALSSNSPGLLVDERKEAAGNLSLSGTDANLSSGTSSPKENYTGNVITQIGLPPQHQHHQQNQQHPSFNNSNNNSNLNGHSFTLLTPDALTQNGYSNSNSNSNNNNNRVSTPTTTNVNGNGRNVNMNNNNMNVSPAMAERQNRALGIFQIDVASLLKKSMISAGYPMEQTEECDEAYLAFVERALEGEHRRVQRIRRRLSLYQQHQQQQQHQHQHQQQQHSQRVNSAGMGMGNNMGNMNMGMGTTSLMNGHNSHNSNYSASSQEKHHHHNGNHNHNHNHNHNNNNHANHDLSHGHGRPLPITLPSTNTHKRVRDAGTSATNSKCTTPNASNRTASSASNNSSSSTISISKDCLHTRHLHRLEGKCGHKAILHRPPDGNPHIDFVVDGKIECYQHCQPLMMSSTVTNNSKDANGNGNGLSSSTDASAFWPSKFRCNQLINHEHVKEDKGCVTCEDKNCQLKTPLFDPMIFDLSDIDFNAGEWKPGFLGNDESSGVDDEALLGSLLKLSEASTASDTMSDGTVNTNAHAYAHAQAQAQAHGRR